MTRLPSSRERGVWFAAAAYGDRDYGEGSTRLLTKLYDHEPTREEIRQDAFVEAVPDWRHRYPHHTLHAACYEWEGTLYDALTISVIPATAAVPPPTIPAAASPANEA